LREARRTNPDDALALLSLSYQSGLAEAFRRGGPHAIALIATTAASQVDASGDHGGAIARLEQAYAMVADDDDAASLLLSAAAVYEVFAGHVSRSETLVSQAVAQLRPAHPLQTRREVESSVGVAGLVALDVSSIEEGARIAIETQRERFDWMATALMVQLVALSCAIGVAVESRKWALRLREYAAEIPHLARVADADVALYALEGRVAFKDAALLQQDAEEIRNRHALWKLLVASLHQQAIRALPEASDTREELRALAPRMNAAYRSGCHGLDEYLDVLDDETREVSLTPPEAPTLVSLPGLFASAEVAAIGGSLSSAADWLVWLEERLPAEVVTSLEWPVCRRRIEGLLLLRLGDVAAGVERLAAGVRCCEERGDVIEAAIGRVQLAAAAEDAVLAWREIEVAALAEAAGVEAAAARLRDEGIDAKRLGDAACRALRRALPSVSRELTAREAQVIGRLAQGKTHREIGQELSLASRVVGGHAASCYAKLEARNRVEAVRIARELAIV
jgi:DNA-binding CsgD family transcriptional regulator